MGLLDKFFNKKPEVVQIQICGVDVSINNKQDALNYAKTLTLEGKSLTKKVNSTSNPRIFFENYLELINNTKNLSKLEKYVEFNGTPPSETLNRLMQQKDNETTFMLHRFYDDVQNQVDSLKTEKAKLNTINKNFDNLSKYDSEMSETNIKLYKSFYDKLINNL